MMIELPFTLVAPAIARDRLLDQVGDLPADAIEDAVLLTSELVTNAVRHGLPPVTLTIAAAVDCLTVTVSDSSPALPRPMEPAASVTGGRGLHIVQSLAQSWGVTLENAGPGKQVWFRLDFK